MVMLAPSVVTFALYLESLRYAFFYLSVCALSGTIAMSGCHWPSPSPRIQSKPERSTRSSRTR